MTEAERKAYIEESLHKKDKIGENIFYTLSDEGTIFPTAGIWLSDGYGKEAAEERANKTKMQVVLVRLELYDVRR